MEPANRLTITTADEGTHVVMSGETHIDFTANPKGHSAPAPGNLGFNQIEMNRVGKHEVDVKEKKNGALFATVKEKLSDDGDELTSTTLSTGHPPQITVWTRTAGKKERKDPFAGEWTEDLSRTRMRQGSLLKIEPAPGGAVHFQGDYSYTARFDGKPYDLKDSRNDTVTLQLTDPHTVDAISKRDNQVTQKDHWQVSTDGQEMTLTSTATLESGQHLTEKLTFKKQ